jgi:alpha-amylase/alpha-mannosidase (GH57 family)
MPEARLDLVLLWHMHQPDFRDQESGEFRQPWVYLHALKDYSDMAAHLERHPGVRAVLNFTPVLLDQLEDYADQFDTGRFRDPLLRLLARPDLRALDEGSRELILAWCFRANHQKMVDPYPAYRRLLDFYTLAKPHGRIGGEYLSAQYLADLLVWYHMAWIGETVRRREPHFASLLKKAEGFSFEDRSALVDLIGREVRAVIPRYRELAARKQIELTSTPDCHPIGPLLLSFEAAREAAPAAPLPAHKAYPGGRERAIAHIDAARERHARRFGEPPRGMWPAEGAVSAEFTHLLAQAGCRWFASGEGVLANSLRKGGADVANRASYLYQPYRVGGITGFFRDDRLSDLIGFEYAKWHSDDAAAAYLGELQALAKAEGPTPVVSIILDGENAWEYYPYNGFYFLDALYAELEKHPDIRTTTFADIVDERHDTAPLPDLVAGSWVYGNLATWIGSPDKNRAWDLLCEAKLAYDARIGSLDPSTRDAATRQLADCEASDWCWWFGDYNPSESVMAFDALYRAKLSHLYRLLGLEPPASLDLPVSRGRIEQADAGDGGTVGAMRRAS